MPRSNATAKFDETVELHLRTGADPRHADQMIRGVAHPCRMALGKTVRVTVFTQGEAVSESPKKRARISSGSDEIIKRVEGWLGRFRRVYRHSRT